MKVDEIDEVKIPLWKGKEGELRFSSQQRRTHIFAKSSPLRIIPRDKRVVVHTRPKAFKSLLRVYVDAIDVGVVQGDVSVIAAFLYGAAFCSVGLYICWTALVFLMMGIVPLVVLVGSMAALMLLSGIYFLRRALHGPTDYPIHFNRKTRMVHVVAIEPQKFFRFWEAPTHKPMASFRWEDTRARTYRRLNMAGDTLLGTATMLGMFCLGDDGESVELILEPGVNGTWSDNGELQLWEHIRSFMEDGGPAVRFPDDMRKSHPKRVPSFPAEVVEAAGGLITDVQPIGGH